MLGAESGLVCGLSPFLVVLGADSFGFVLYLSVRSFICSFSLCVSDVSPVISSLRVYLARARSHLPGIYHGKYLLVRVFAKERFQKFTSSKNVPKVRIVVNF